MERKAEMSDLASRLLEMREKIDSAKEEKSKLEGRRDTYMEQLKTKFGCKTVEAAKKKLATLQDDIEKKEKELVTGMNQLEEEYEWD